MTTSNPIDLAAEIVTSFVSNNSVPRGELPALIEAVHAAVKRLADGGEVAPAAIDPPAPAVSIRKSVTPDYLICLDDGRKIQISATASGDARDDAGAVSREMEPAFRLSHGRAQLRGAAVGAGEEHRARAIAPEARCYSVAERRCSGCRCAAGEPRRDRGCRRPTGERRRNRRGRARSRRRRREQDQDQDQGQEREKVAAPPEATAKRKSGRARKATA